MTRKSHTVSISPTGKTMTRTMKKARGNCRAPVDGRSIPGDDTSSGLASLGKHAVDIGGSFTVEPNLGGGRFLRWTAPLT